MADSRSITSNTSSGKRKRTSPLAFYAVKVGRTPGVYQTWDEANRQVQGFPNPVYKKFSTYSEAEAMLKGSASSASSTPKSGKTTKYYGVAVGHVPGVYTDYATVQAQTKGCAGCKQKAFATWAEAQAYVDEFKRGASAPISLRGDLSETSSLAAGKGCKVGDHVAKKQKKDHALPKALTNGNVHYEPGMGPLPPDSEDGFDRTIKLDVDTGNIRAKTEEELNATKRHPTGEFSGPIVVYTDGSSLGNGQAGAVAGVGVYFGPKDPRNVSEPLRGDRQTNQRAELTAVARALDHIPIDRDVLIVTDSYYSIRCLTEWFQNWEKHNWKTSSGKAVENRDLIEPIIARIRERDMCKAKTNFKWIKGHANDPGNVAADSLAVQGSRSSTPELRNAPEISETLRTPTRSPYFMPRKKDPERALEAKSQPKPEPGPEVVDDAADYEALFAELEAEQSTDPAPKQHDVPPAITGEKSTQIHVKDNQEHLEHLLNGSGSAP
ncbi:ribonuclease H-like domain-containing protein [Pyrenochaeta sp. MPI-SDFR-AT-0127]|nr:ribonuclease H-like domain-containing protein [Pyrenochaeta sp. MPI-SDFR-AT-0127]